MVFVCVDFVFGDVLVCLKLFYFVFGWFIMFEVALGRLKSCLDLFLVVVHFPRCCVLHGLEQFRCFKYFGGIFSVV